MSKTAARYELAEERERKGSNIGSTFMAAWWQENTPESDSSATPRDVAYLRIGNPNQHAGGLFLKNRRLSIDCSVINRLKQYSYICRRGLARAYFKPAPAAKTLAASLD